MPITSWKRERERFGSGTRGEVASTSDAAEISCEMFWEAKGRGERRTANGALNKNIHWTERGSAGARLTVLWSLIVSETRRYRSARVEGINLILIVSGPSSSSPHVQRVMVVREKSLYGRSRLAVSSRGSAEKLTELSPFFLFSLFSPLPLSETSPAPSNFHPLNAVLS